MNYKEAVKAINAGKVVRRKGHEWLENDQYLFVARIQSLYMLPEAVEYIKLKSPLSLSREVHIMHAKLDHAKIWEPSPEDIKANDYEYVSIAEPALG